MYRRASEYFRGRSSISVVNETRGAPYRGISIVLALFFLVFGIRDMFFCGTPFTSHEMELKFVEIWQDCDTNVYQEGFSGLVGLENLIISILRFNVAFADTTADLYRTMMLLVFIDYSHIFLITRSPPIVIPIVYCLLVVAGAIYETYILYLARRAYLSRLKSRTASRNEKPN